MITASCLTRRFGSRLAVDGVSFDVSRSEIVALLGPNGAGKTTTMRILGGLIAATSGAVTIDGTPLTPATGAHLRRRIGFLTETPGLWDRLTVRENLRVYAGLYDVHAPDARIAHILDMFDLSDRSDTRAAELSKGLRQKVAIARTVLHEPDVLLLDEPTSGLDPEVSRGVRRLFEERRAAGCAILLSTHNLDEAERLADRVAVLHGRLLALDRPAELRKRLTTGRLLVRVAADPSGALAIARTYDQAASIEGDAVLIALADTMRDTPTLVRALVSAGLDVLEIRPEVPALEDVYVHLMGAEHPRAVTS